ncbi:Adenylate cyclase, class 3 [Salinimicrobium catena]|uniref:Adenylate cyclase n=1 Tax=Salinimicrobium catena TaxID=390640 RepID=A0A1H5N288_9FLAO|nr:adenylate/guanylate cyclase domain-containing protein [Salinimicrobium catena]SDL34952.1 Adenylate cyclase, class 3 [Salinimicrobium catena]SEE95653.1 Adenylate cyclase, class 3 [Salinimicrobium catena]
MYTLRIIVILLFLLPGFPGIGQERYDLDSLKQIFYSTPSRQNDLELLRAISYGSMAPDSIVKFSDLLIKASLESSNRYFLMKGNHKRGVAWQRKGEYDKALEDLFKAAELADAIDSISSLGNTYIEIANVYSESDNSTLAFSYYNRGIEALRRGGDSLAVGLTLYNFGDDLYESGKLDSALLVTRQARTIFKKYKRSDYEAYSLGNLGRIYARQGQMDRAEGLLNRAIDTLEQYEDYIAITDFAGTLAEVALERGDTLAAIRFAERSLEAAENFQLKEDLKNAHFQLSQLYESVGDSEEALKHYKQFVRFKDNLENVEAYRNMANLRTDYELAKKQNEVDLLNEQRKNQQIIVVASIIALGLILLLALGLYRRNKFIGRTKKIIEKEKNRSELLLLNILPQETALELKEKGRVAAKRFESATILFTDFKNFTHYAENLSPEELVKSVDFYFSEFDRIVEKFGLEKIKTVGDAYMCASGVPFPSEDHAERVVAAACEMLDFVNDAKNLTSEVETRFDIRIGINTGPVVAGVVGSKKFAYDIWGDAVNIASRMETTSENGKINISENTYQLIKEKFQCSFRGEIPVKHKGMMKMYFVDCMKDPASWPQNEMQLSGK